MTVIETRDVGIMGELELAADPAAPPRWGARAGVWLVGLVAGAAAGLNSVADAVKAAKAPDGQLLGRVVVGEAMGLLVAMAFNWGARALADALRQAPDVRRRYLRYDARASCLLLLTLLGAVGVRFVGPIAALLAVLVLGAKVYAFVAATGPQQRRQVAASRGWLAFLFLVSGFAALIYQIVWERALFSAFGVNIESITIVVSLFMLGLGLGSMAGGIVARRFPGRARGCSCCAKSRSASSDW